MKSLLTALVLVLCMFTLSTSASTDQSVDLAQVDKQQNLVDYMFVLDDASYREATPAQLLGSASWVPASSRPELISVPRRESHLWLQLMLHNGQQEPLTRWLDVAPWRLSRIEACLVVEHSNSCQQIIKTGLDVPLAERKVTTNRALLPVRLDPGEQVRLLLFIASDSRPFLQITSQDPLAFTRAESRRYLFHSVLLAVVLTLFTVLLLQLNLRFMLVGLWMLSMFVFESEKEGYISYLLLQGAEEYASQLRFFSSVLAKTLFMLVSVYLLDLQKHRIWRWVVPFFLFLAVIYAAACLWLEAGFLRQLALYFHLGCALLWPLLVPAALGRRHAWQRWLLLLLTVAWLTSSLFVFSYIFNIHYTAEFAEPRITTEALVVLGLLLVYARQKSQRERSMRARLQQMEEAYRRQLEQAVIARSEELDRAIIAARQAELAKTEFLARVSHDLKSPLTAIMGFAQLMGLQPGRARDFSEIIKGSADQMLNQIDRLLADGRQASNKDS